MGHLKMMAAAQPFLSGAISKTVNMPEQATVDEVMQTYIDAWRMGLKSVAIYRENSKRCSPLNTGKDAPGAPTTPLDPRIAQMEAEIAALRAKVESPYRRRMSTTRLSYTHKFEIAGHEGYLTVGLYPDGQPGELFIQMAKEGSTIGGLMDTIATLTSMALQYGVPLESLVNKFAYQRFDPSGFTKNRDIQPAYSITDYVFRWLGCQFIPGYRKSIAPHRDQPDLPMPEIRQMDRQAINRPVADLPVTADPTDPADSTFVPAPVSGAAGPPPAHQPPSNGGGAPPAPALSAMEHAFTGNTCGNCFSNKMVLVGACEVCLNCGETGGCG